MVNLVYIDGSGHKAARAVRNREEYFRLRNTEENRRFFEAARGGDKKAKGSQCQFTYNDMLPDGVLRGCCHAASTFAHDIDCGNEEECKAIAERMLGMKEEIGLLELTVSSGWGLHAVCLREKGKTILENQVRIAMLTQTEMDTSTHDEQRVMFTGPATDDVLLFLDDRIFEETLTPEESAAEYQLLRQREKEKKEEVPAGAKKANKHYRPWEEGSEELRVKSEESNGGQRPLTHSSLRGGVSNPEENSCNSWSEKNTSWSGATEQTRFIAEGVMRDKGLERSFFLDEGARHNSVKVLLSGMTQLLSKAETNGVLQELMPDHWKDENIQKLVDDFYLNYTKPNQRLTRVQEQLFVKGMKLSMNGNGNGNGNVNGNGNGNGNVNGNWNKTTNFTNFTNSEKGGNANGGQRPLTPSNLRGGVDYGEDDEDVDGNGKNPVDSMPTPPRVMKELLSICPKDFVIPAINALLPILGTLTSFVRAEDSTNCKTISTSFFSIVYAPPSSGKSFVERFINLLLSILFRRDELNDARDAVYARSLQKKSANDKGEALPQTSIRIMEAKNSEAEFLEKQRNNRGHHMFTYCSEIDQWKKGVRAAGGNKDDMIRIAWDNGRYGQNFKSANTFKGKVALFWNVLICGTEDQLMSYFRNVTNGLVTRCSFTKLENQQFREHAPEWKKHTKQALGVINDFIDRCDAATYAQPLDYDVEQCWEVSDEDFDKDVPWKMTFKPLKHVSIDWIVPTIQAFQKEQTHKAIVDNDDARDVFRRRVGDRAKRIALMCTQFYRRPMTISEKKLCSKWIAWWMEQDIEGVMKPFGQKYVKQIQESAIEDVRHRTIYDRMADEFTKDDLRRTAEILGFTTQPNKIVHRWVKAGVIEKFAKDCYRKVKADQNSNNNKKSKTKKSKKK